MEPIGKRLREIRLKKGLTLEELHRKTKIHLNILKAIEEDNFSNLNSVYVKGFLKLYCQCLGVDPKEYISDFEKQISTRSPLEIKEPISSSKKPFLSHNLLIVSFIIASSIFLVSLSYFLYLSLKNKPSSKHKIEKKHLKVIPEEEKRTKPNLPLESIKLGLRAEEDCWLELKVDGQVVFRGILKKGKYESWQAKQKIEFSLGNAGVVKLELNGEILPPLGKKGQSLKDVLISKEKGLVIPQ